MGSFRGTRDSLRSMLRIALLLAALATYIVSPDDLVWRFIKLNPHSRILEHFAFSIAAILLGLALFLKIRASTLTVLSPIPETFGSLLQAIGIGFLLPLPGFLLLVFGDLTVSLLFRKRKPDLRGEPQISQTPSWTRALVEHVGLCCGVGSRVCGSSGLVDRGADGLFAVSALTSLVASFRRALQAPSRS